MDIGKWGVCTAILRARRAHSSRFVSVPYHALFRNEQSLQMVDIVPRRRSAYWLCRSELTTRSPTYILTHAAHTPLSVSFLHGRILYRKLGRSYRKDNPPNKIHLTMSVYAIFLSKRLQAAPLQKLRPKSGPGSTKRTDCSKALSSRRKAGDLATAKWW